MTTPQLREYAVCSAREIANAPPFRANPASMFFALDRCLAGGRYEAA
jgi:hypothetical protein